MYAAENGFKQVENPLVSGGQVLKSGKWCYLALGSNSGMICMISLKLLTSEYNANTEQHPH